METSAHYTRIPNWTVPQSYRQSASPPSHTVPPSSAMLPSNMHPHIYQPVNGYGVVYNQQQSSVFHPPNLITAPGPTSYFLPVHSNPASQPQSPPQPQACLKTQQVNPKRQQLVFIPANIDKIMQSYNNKPQNSLTTRVVKPKKSKRGQKSTAIPKHCPLSSSSNHKNTFALPSISTVIQQQLPNQFELAPIRSVTKYIKN